MPPAVFNLSALKVYSISGHKYQSFMKGYFNCFHLEVILCEIMLDFEELDICFHNQCGVRAC